MSPRVKHGLQLTGYILFGVFCTAAFVYLTFPLEVLQGRMAKELEKQFPQAHISFEHASTYRLSGLDIDDVSITLEQPGDKPAVTLRIDRVRARIQILPLLRKHYNVVFDVTLGEGSLSGVLSTNADGFGLQLDANDVDLGRPALIGKFLGANVTGELAAKIDMSVDFNDPKKSVGGGTIDLKKGALGELVVNNITPMMPGAFTLPATALGSLAIALEMKEGQLVIKKFEQKSEDLEVKLTGDLGVRKQMNQSPLNLQMQYKLTDTYTQKNGKMALLAMKKGPDGFTNVKLGGTVGAPMPQL